SNTDFSPAFKVLMAEDNIVNQKLAQQLFAKWGIYLDIAVNGIHALERMRAATYDMVLMDLQMPEMDGITAMKKIRAGEAGDVNRDIPVIALTADVFEDSRKRAEEAGFNAFITKPYNNSELYQKMINYKKSS